MITDNAGLNNSLTTMYQNLCRNMNRYVIHKKQESLKNNTIKGYVEFGIICFTVPDNENAWQRKPVKSRVCGT